MLVCSSLALIATSPPPIESTGSAEGEAVVGPGHPTSIDVRFDVAPYVSDTPRATVEVFVPEGRQEARVHTDTIVRVDGQVVPRGTLEGWDLPTQPCADGCHVEVHVDLAWAGRPEPDIDLLWRIETTFERETIAIRTTTGSPPRASLAPIHLFGLGLAGGLLTGIGWLRAGPRFRWLRLGIVVAAGIILFVQILPWLASLFALDLDFIWFRPDYFFWPIALALVLAGLALALRWHLGGRGLALGVAGWLGLVGAGGYLATVAEATTAFRPAEMLLLGLAIGLPSSAAITSPPLVRSGRRISQGEVLFVASQVLLILLVAGATVFVVPQLVSDMARGRTDDIIVSACIIGELALLIVGYRRSRRGSGWMLVLANVLALLPSGLLALLLLGGGSILTTPSLTTRVLALVPALAALAGIVGGLALRPTGGAAGTPDAEQHRHEQDGEDKEVAGVGNKGDPAWLRNRLAEQRRADDGERPLGNPEQGAVGPGGGLKRLDGDESSADGERAADDQRP
jgi:hypothetical protein